MGLDVNPETGDALFGYESASFEFRDIYPNPTGDGFLYSYNFWRGDGETWNVERLLTVKDCLAFTAADWDGDGVTELLVRTRWAEKPTRSTITWTGPSRRLAGHPGPELAQDLLTDVEREEQFREQLRQEGAEPAAERDDSGDFAL